MSVPEFVITTLVLITAAITTVALALLYLAAQTYRAARRHLKRHRRRNQPLTDREVMDALAPFGADISIWPSRAPRNGTTHDTHDPVE